MLLLQHSQEFCSIHKYEPPGRHYQLASLALVHAAIAAKREYDLPIVAIGTRVMCHALSVSRFRPNTVKPNH